MRESEFGIIIFMVKIDRFLRLISIPMDWSIILKRGLANLPKTSRMSKAFLLNDRGLRPLIVLLWPTVHIHSPSAVPNNTHIPKIEQQSPRVNDSDPVQITTPFVYLMPLFSILLQQLIRSVFRGQESVPSSERWIDKPFQLLTWFQDSSIPCCAVSTFLLSSSLSDMQVKINLGKGQGRFHLFDVNPRSTSKLESDERTRQLLTGISGCNDRRSRSASQPRFSLSFNVFLSWSLYA
jgi:hypothetical protein